MLLQVLRGAIAKPSTTAHDVVSSVGKSVVEQLLPTASAQELQPELERNERALRHWGYIIYVLFK